MANEENREAEAVTIYTTLDTEDAARDFASKLLDERLIACANVFPVWSMFHWEGAVKSQSELVVFLKTTRARVEDLRKRIPEIHPYEVPCIEVYGVNEAHAPFAKWLADEADGRPGERAKPEPRH